MGWSEFVGEVEWPLELTSMSAADLERSGQDDACAILDLAWFSEAAEDRVKKWPKSLLA